ncbi:S-adenosyl-L-methionine-dependent tRNA 4-demethylwyosine synthase TYW1-like, partial [Leptonychotes weddellii]|uniref:S-adenosyl-L-methionine-dependent tRNA 4-demethylwyosine synthase TYW1-like n=1 Tax=Leptonychotes weddellii TaxID=9713 RepID=A0A2U3Z7S4_LEPWE
HHTNPVGTEWRWKMDQPEMILKEAIENHQNMIKQFKGVPGVKEERFEEGMMVKHCALSLVGEPIMYPEINRFLKLLHECKISSFLVTNAQFPVEISIKVKGKALRSCGYYNLHVFVEVVIAEKLNTGYGGRQTGIWTPQFSFPVLCFGLQFFTLYPNMTDNENYYRILKNYSFLFLVGFENLHFKHPK